MTLGNDQAQALMSIGRPLEISLTKALAAAGNYAAEDVLSESAGSGTSWNFANIVPKNGGSGTITKAVALFETTGLTPKLVLFLFSAEPTSAVNDNVANTAVLHADEANFIGWIEFEAMEDIGGDSMAIATPGTNGNIPLDFLCGAADRDLYGIVATRDAITAETATDDLIIKLFIRQD